MKDTDWLVLQPENSALSVPKLTISSENTKHTSQQLHQNSLPVEDKSNASKILLPVSSMIKNKIATSFYHSQIYFFIRTKSVYSLTRAASCLLERVACCIERSEPVLLVGETGAGKTATIQLLAQKANRQLKVINMNQHSDSADLLGG